MNCRPHCPPCSPARATRGRPPRHSLRGLTLVEMLVYVVVLVAVLGVGYGALGRLWTVSGHFRRETDDLRAVLAAGERWREDVRAAGQLGSEAAGAAQFVTLRPKAGAEIQWAFADGSILRRTGATNDWTPLVKRVRASVIGEDVRGSVKAWRWDLELEPISKRARFRRQFTFLAVPNLSPP